MIIKLVRSTMRSYCGHVGATRRAGEVRASAPIRVLVAVFVALLAVHFMPGTAYADSINAEIISGPSQVPILDMYGASIAAPDRYTAAALLMGYGPGVISGWNDDVKAKLSNEGTGGQFYIFANNSVQNYFDITEHTGIFQQFFDFVGGAFWNTAQTLYGNSLWAALYTSDELAAAKADLERVLSGEDIGGGSGGGSSGRLTTIPFNSLQADWYTSSTVMNIGGVSYYLALSRDETATEKRAIVPFNVTIPETAYAGMPSGDYVYCYQFLPSYSYGKNYFKLIIDAVPVDSFTLETNDRFPSVQYLRLKDGYTCYRVTFNTTQYTPTVTGAELSLPTATATTYGSNTSVTIGGVGYAKYYYTTLDAGGGEPVIPPSNWPQEPQAPEPPELPEPGDPVVEPPEPYEPSTGPTYIWNTTNTSEPTDTSDLLEWIKKIFYELKAIHSDLKNWFENLGSAISDGFEAMDNACGQIYDAINEQTDEMISQISGLKTYLKQLFDWLGDKMNFQAEGYDDTSVIYWLKRIWSKLGNGDINVRPTDPTTDPTGVWDWLIKLIQNFLIGLASSANDLISEMADLVSQVMHEFPFSIPWDIAAFLAAFAAAPITPDVDVTIPAIEGWWGDTVISIDLSPYDNAAAAVRAMEKILFAAFLAWKSKELLEFMDVTKWFNG